MQLVPRVSLVCIHCVCVFFLQGIPVKRVAVVADDEDAIMDEVRPSA